MKKSRPGRPCSRRFRSARPADVGGEEGDRISTRNGSRKRSRSSFFRKRRPSSRSLKTAAEKDRFIELFWAKRDPSPGSKVNEFRDEWMARLAHVNKTYASGVGPKGWRSDMGKVYLMFGPPSQVKGGATGVRTEAQEGTQFEAPAEFWIYPPMPDLSLTDQFTIIFRNYQSGLRARPDDAPEDSPGHGGLPQDRRLQPRPQGAADV